MLYDARTVAHVHLRVVCTALDAKSRHRRIGIACELFIESDVHVRSLVN